MGTFIAEVASNVTAGVIVKVGTLLIKAAKFDAVDELKKLNGELKKVQILFDNLRTTEIWQCETADVFRVFYDIEDLVDDLDDLMDGTSNSSLSKKIKKSFKGKSISTRKRIKEVRERLEGIISVLELENRTQQQWQQCHCQRDAKKVPVPALDEFLGRKEEKEEVIRLLLDDNITSVTIVGIGGLGKTTLAQHVQIDPRIKEKFHPNIWWVIVAAEFDLKAIAEDILHRSLESFQPNIICGLFEKLRAGKSSLIVLDGLQDVRSEDWRSFSSVFLPTETGCKVLITTHNPWVAVKTKAELYHLPFMKDEDCQSLVNDSALSYSRLDSRQHSIVKENVEAITKKSKGLPLAARILGWYLPSKCDDNDWINNDIYDMKEFKEEIFPKFNLNTVNMSSDVKRCLAYCSLFPRNHDLKRDTLVELWMAEGFIQSQGERSLRQIGIEYINDLYGNSFFQPSDPSEHQISSYKMHEFIHRFAEIVASGICFRLEDINDFSSDLWCKRVRHLSLLCTSVQSYLDKIEECDGLRTFLLPSKHQMLVGQIPYSFFRNLRHLRVLDLSGTDVRKIPGSLGILKHLRYLDLSETLIMELPSISKLCQLQVLKLTGCPELLQLPTDLYTLTSLVHLDVDIQRLRCMPARVGSLIHLQTLPIFFVGDREGYCITELQNLKQLRGTLNLVGLEKIRDEAEARKAKLWEKKSLRRLELEWSSNFTNGARAVDVFTGLKPNNLYVEELKVTHYPGSSFPTWLTSQSCTLESIQVIDCLLDDVLPTLGQLPFLKNLHLEGMHRVTHMRNPVCGVGSGGAFPSLKSLKIKNMMHLTRWHEFPNNCMPKLNKLTITDCENLSSVQSLNSLSLLQTLEISRCPVLEALPQLPPSVQSLIIIRSNMMIRDWDRMKSIPSVEIDGNKINFP